MTGPLETHWTSIAGFISSNSEKFQAVFSHVLAYCVELGLAGGDTFAIDGLRLPSNASIQMSGAKEELEKKLAMYQRMAEKHVAKHRKRDAGMGNAKETERNYQKRQKHLNRQIEKTSGFLRCAEQKKGKNDKEAKSNAADNESALLRSSAGYLQGYIGMAVSDKKNQVIVNAEAVGSANEGECLPDMLDKALESLDGASVKMPGGTKPVFMADANYFSEENLKACHERGVEAIIPDGHYNRRLGSNNERRYEAKDFKSHTEENYYECPNGKKLEYKWQKVLGGQEGKVYQASVKDCRCDRQDLI